MATKWQKHVAATFRKNKKAGFKAALRKAARTYKKKKEKKKGGKRRKRKS